MGRKRISGIARGTDQTGNRQSGSNTGRVTTQRRPARRPAGLAIIERDGRFHLSGRIRIKGRSIRVRASTGLAALAANREAAEECRRQKEQEVRDAVLWGIHPTVPLAVAAEAYLNRQRKRPLNAIDVSRIKELDRKFGARHLNEITEAEWNKFVDARMAERAAVTRERYIDLVLSFLTWCKAPPQRWLSADLPAFNRDREAREHKEARARRVGELRPELIALLIEHAAPHLRGQMAIKWTSGARVSSIIYDCRLCDYLAAPGREQITFHDTKNGDRVEASVNPWAAAIMAEYLAWRGRLEDREARLFLTHRRRPYKDNGKAAGGQTKTGFKGMRRRTIATLRREALTESARLRRAGQGAAARDHWRAVRHGDIALLAKLTPHWFRHLLATNLLATGDLKSTMEQGGWRDARSVMRYAHDVPERRRQLVEQMAAPAATFWPRTPGVAANK
jgi:hypothetical protein